MQVKIFLYKQRNNRKILKLAKDNKITVEDPIKLENIYRFKSKELKHIEENLYSIPYKKDEEVVENLRLFLANNQYSEIEEVAKQITNL